VVPFVGVVVALQAASVMQRHLGRFDLTCIGLGAIIGSGIFVLPGRLAKELGPASIVAFLLCGILCVPLALGYAKASTLSESSGASYVYGRIAFGDRVGFATGWVSWINMVVSWAAVAMALGPMLAPWWAPFGSADGKTFAVIMIVALGLINVIGVRPSAWFVNVVTVLKLLPLLALLIVGMANAKPAALVPFAPKGFSGLGPALFAALFAYQGFESVPVPAGEARQASQAVPRAVVYSFLVALLFYASLQAVAVMHAPGLAASTAPLVDAARGAGGAGLAALVGAAATISILGFNVGIALIGPRYLSAMAEQGQLPGWLGRSHPRFGTPHLAVVATSLGAAAISLLLDFSKLVDLSNVTVLLQYLVTMGALIRLILSPPPGRAKLQMAGGAILPILGALVAVYLLQNATRAELLVVAILVVVGLVVAEISRRAATAPGPSA
jgi:amino acid transporter